MKQALIAWLLLAAILLYAKPPSADRAPEPVVIGALYNLTGSQSGLDIPSSRGARLAVAEANQGGGVLGANLQLVLKDGETRPAVIAREAAAMIEAFPTISALMGLSDTDMVLAAAPVAARHGRLFLTSGATSPELPAQVPEYLFLACFGDSVQAAAAAEWAFDQLGARTAVVLYNDTMSYTRLLHGYFASSFEALGGQIISSVRYSPGNPGEAVAALAKADIIYLAAGPEDAVSVSNLIREAGVTAPIIGGDGFDSEGLWQAHPYLSDIYFTTHAYLGADNPDPKVVAFRAAYKAAYPDSNPDAFAALGYDTINLLLAAMTKAGSADPDKVRDALANIQNFEGVTGTLSYAPGSRIPTKSVTILKIDDGKQTLEAELTPTHVPVP